MTVKCLDSKDFIISVATGQDNILLRKNRIIRINNSELISVLNKWKNQPNANIKQLDH